jgi:hypothetical protein
MEIKAARLKKMYPLSFGLFLLFFIGSAIIFKKSEISIGLAGSYVVSLLNLFLLSKIVGRLLTGRGSKILSISMIFLKFLLIILAIALLIKFFHANPISMAVGFTVPLLANLLSFSILPRQ